MLKVENCELESKLDLLLYKASHDLRSPIASILGLATLGNKESKSKNIREYFDFIRKSALKQDKILSDIRNYYMCLNEPVVVEQINLAPFIKGIINEYQVGAVKKIIDKLEIVGDGIVNTDPISLDIIFDVLISNSVKFCRNDRVNIHIRIKSYTDITKIVFIDEGIGIDPEHISNIYKMFYRGSEKNSGAGLGLFIVGETIKKINGTISVRSIKGRGTTFIIQLPNNETVDYNNIDLGIKNANYINNVK